LNRSIYLDHHATTPLDPRVLEAMTPYLTEEFGNPSSGTHGWGERSLAAVEEARASLAMLLGCHPDEIVFTAGATEANNLAIKGGARASRKRLGGTHVVGSRIEHKSVSSSLHALVEEGFELTEILPDRDGLVSAEGLRDALRKETVLASVMTANSEIGTLEPVAEMAAACRERGVLFHTDATQAVGRLPIDVRETGVDLLSLSAHKFYGPKGVGALFIRRGVVVLPLITGGGQERGLRAGTLNVPGIVGLGAAARFAREEMADETERLTRLRDSLWREIQSKVPGCRLNGHPQRRLPGNLNVEVPGVDSAALMIALKDFAFSAGSACASGASKPSEVLTAIGLDRKRAFCSIRIGLGKGTTEDDVTRFAASLETAVNRIRPRQELQDSSGR